MTLDLQASLAQMVNQYPQLGELSQEQLIELACEHDIGLWSTVKRGFTNAEVHWVWYDLIQSARRAAVLAPREHGKSEIFSVNQAAHKAIYNPGWWTYIFCNSGDQGEKILGRTVAAIAETAPQLLDNPKTMHTKEIVLANDARITVRGSGAAVRGAHPDLIIGDDVQDENNTGTQMQRDRLKSWWFGAVGGMAHPGTSRVVRQSGREPMRTNFPPTRIILVGTPFHALDLLMSCRENEIYEWRMFAAVTEAPKAGEAA